jgi:hypothetical protein
MATSVPSIPPPNFDPFENGAPATGNGAHEQIPEPTTSQQVEQLHSSGESAATISAVLGVPQTQVDSALGITSAPITPTGPTAISIQA